MKNKVAIFVILVVGLIAASAFALPPVGYVHSLKSSAVQDYDVATYYDANQLLVFVSNLGSIGMDQSMHFGRSEGFYYPYTGDSLDIIYNDFDKTVVYAAGLILAGKVNGEVRTAVAAYDATEFVPGPMVGGAPAPDQPSFRVYKIDAASGPGDPDYDDWPDSLGAPVNPSGDPMLLGDQTLWAIFNDADADRHDNYYGGGTAPLGIEVQQTVWGSGVPGEESVLYLKYKLYNKGVNAIDSFYISFWADPDLAGPNDDLVGCDTLHDIFFCFNHGNYDEPYDSIPPAWGGKVVSGPVVSSPGDTAWFDGRPLPDYRNMEMSAFIRYVNGTEPDSPGELFLYARGRDAATGMPLIDPETGDSITFFAPGNPLARRGWTDLTPADQRVMVSFGPLTFNPGDSQQVAFKLGAWAEQDRLFSLSVLRHILDPDIPVDSVIDTLLYVEPDSVQIVINDYGLSRVSFTPIKERWLTGYNWDAPYFYGGADYACDFFGSYLDPAVYPDSFPSVEVRFSNSNGQKAYRYEKGHFPDYPYKGYSDVPFTVWDIDNERQLNAAFVEYYESNVYDHTWGPDILENRGGWELLFIFNSDYSGEYPDNTGIDYTSLTLLDGADSLDLLYVVWPAALDTNSLSLLEDGQKLSFIGQFLNPDGIVDTVHFPAAEIGDTTGQSVSIRSYSSGPTFVGLESSDPDAFRPSTDILKFSDLTEQRIWINFSPYREGQYDEVLYVIDSVNLGIVKTVHLLGRTRVITDVNDSRARLPSRFALHQNYPNPFNARTAISFTVDKRSVVNLTIYNLLGRKVKTLVNEERAAGTHTTHWDGTDSRGGTAASGIYFYRFITDDFTESRKMVFLK